MAAPAAGLWSGPAERFVGITVMPEYLQVEGIDRVLDNIVTRARATAVTTAPYVMEPAGEKTGSREPPIDAGAGKVRLLDRPLWGKRELFVRTAPGFVPDSRLYQGLRYQPADASDLSRRHGGVVRDFIREARARKLKVYFQVQAAIPPGYRVQFGGPSEDDRPRLPDGRIPPRRLANNGSLASPHIRAYTEALIRDLLRAYPDIDGFRLDWPEYPPYFLDDVFLDFNASAGEAAVRLGFPFEQMRRVAGDLYRKLHGRLTNDDLAQWLAQDGGLFPVLSGLIENPALLDWLRFKAVLVEELIAGVRKTLTESGGRGKELVPNSFPPPFSLVSGMDFSRAARHSNGISVKLYTMHWPVILRFYGDALLGSNPGLSESLLVRTLVRLLDISDDSGFSKLSDYHYPEPEEAHPVGLKAQARKVLLAQQSAGATPIYALAHGYGPVADFRRRLEAVYKPARQRVWVNRYGYLSDEKLEVIGEVTAGSL